MKKKLFQSKDKKQKQKMNRIISKNSLRSKMIENQKRFTLNTIDDIIPDDGEHLLQYRQKDFIGNISVQNRAQIYDLNLEFGDYKLDYSTNGRNLLLGSSLGHICLLEWKTKSLIKEFHVQDQIRDIKFLHNVFFGTAQKNNIFIYDQEGLEIHQLSQIHEPQFLEYLPYHYNLVAITLRGKIFYIDCSTGQTSAELKTKIQNPKCLIKNPSNGLISIGSKNGVVSFFTPNTQQSVLKVLCHNATINGIAFSQNGNYMTTIGSDNQMKIFDLRNSYKELDNYYLPKESRNIQISQNGLLAVSCKKQLLFYKNWFQEKQNKPYLKHEIQSQKVINDFKFVPYEDFLGLSYDQGFSSILIPGSGYKQYDTYEVNVQGNKKQMRESEVKKLLEKLPLETINLDPYLIGKIDPVSKQILEQEKREEYLESMRKKLIQKKNKKKKNKRNNEIVQNIHKTEMNREQVRANNALQKELYRAEQNKIESEMMNLNQGIDDIIQVTQQNLKNIHDISE